MLLETIELYLWKVDLVQSFLRNTKAKLNCHYVLLIDVQYLTFRDVDMFLAAPVKYWSFPFFMRVLNSVTLFCINSRDNNIVSTQLLLTCSSQLSEKKQVLNSARDASRDFTRYGINSSCLIKNLQSLFQYSLWKIQAMTNAGKINTLCINPSIIELLSLWAV